MSKPSIADRYLRTLEENSEPQMPEIVSRKNPTKKISSYQKTISSSSTDPKSVLTVRSDGNKNLKSTTSSFGNSKPSALKIQTNTAAFNSTPRVPKSLSTPMIASPSTISPIKSVGPRPDRNPLMHNENLTPSQISWDKERQNWQAYEYLCHVVEAKEWMEKILGETLPPAEEFPESLQNGIALAKITKKLHPELMQWPVFEHKRLQYRHTENITQFFSLLDLLRIPQLFLFDMTDLYEKRNLPKVIYCIHAVSHFIAEQQSTVSAVEDLVGKLDFSDDQLLTTQKGLAGQNMPNFGAMNRKLSGKHPELGAELEKDLAHLDDIPEHGATRRKQNPSREPPLSPTNSYSENEKFDSDLDDEREYEISNRRSRPLPKQRRRKYDDGEDLDIGLDVPNVSSLRISKSKSSRYIDRDLQYSDDDDEMLNILPQRSSKQKSRIQAIRKASRDTRIFSPTYYNNRYSQYDSRGYGYRNLSSMTILRKEAYENAERILMELDALEPEIIQFQAVCRRRLIESQNRKIKTQFDVSISIPKIQGLVRGYLLQKVLKKQRQELSTSVGQITALQAIIRGRKISEELKEFSSSVNEIIKFQAIIRSRIIKNGVAKSKKEISEAINPAFVELQAIIRGKIFRGTYTALASGANDIAHFQGLARGILVRRSISLLKTQLQSNLSTKAFVRLQSAFRGRVLRYEIGCLYEALDHNIDSIVNFQAIGRGTLREREVKSIVQVWNANTDVIIRIQSIWRTKTQGKHYRSFIGGANPSLASIKPFLQLIDDNPTDYENEMKLETLLKENSSKIKENEVLEAKIHQLDMKIALLVKNNINIDEVVLRNQKQNGRVIEFGSDQDDNAEPNMSNPTNDPHSKQYDLKETFNINSMLKSSRERVELYECLFYVLQTQPQYTRELMYFKPARPLRTAELIFSIFGQGKTNRERFFLLNLLEKCITSTEVGNEENTVSWEIVSHLNMESKSLEIRKVILRPACERLKLFADQLLEYDPHLIYEHMTGGGDLSPEDAIREPSVRNVFVQNLQHLREITSIIIQETCKHFEDLPYHIRFLSKQAFRKLLQTTNNKTDAMSAASQVIISQFIHPALLSADSLELVDAAVGHTSKNLLYVSRILHQVGVMMPFAQKGSSDIFLQPLNDFVKSSSRQFAAQLLPVIQKTPDLSRFFNITEADDYTMHGKPRLRLPVDYILAVHNLCYQQQSALIGEGDTILKPLLEQLGPLPRDAREMVDIARFKTLNLSLNSRFCTASIGMNSEGNSALMATTLRCLGYVLQVQQNYSDLMSVLLAPVTEPDEHKFYNLLNTGNAREAAGELGNLTYKEVKHMLLEKVVELESSGAITRQDDYQTLINKIADDIRSKDTVRKERKQNLESRIKTNKRLNEKNAFLKQRLETYNADINNAMRALQLAVAQSANVKTKRFQKFQLSSLKTHESNVKVPELGRYRVTADKLYEKGILIRLRGYSERKRKEVVMTFSSYQVAQFQLEVTYKDILLPNGSILITVDDLLLHQYQGNQYIECMDDNIQFSTNRLLSLIFKKFYGTDN